MRIITPLEGLVTPELPVVNPERLFIAYNGQMDDSAVRIEPRIPNAVSLTTYRREIQLASDLLAEYRAGAHVDSQAAQRRIVAQYGAAAPEVTKARKAKAEAAYAQAQHAFYAASGSTALIGTSLTGSERKYRAKVLDPSWDSFVTKSRLVRQRRAQLGTRTAAR